jgi:hypothetical protein
VNRTEAALVLAKAAAYDGRQVPPEAPQAWAEALADVDGTDAARAVVAFYATATAGYGSRIMPGDIRAGVTAIRRQRCADAPSPQPPAEIDPDDTRALQRYTRTYWHAIGDGATPDEADEAGCRAAGVTRKQIIQASRPVEAVVLTLAKTTKIPRKA